MAVVSLNNLTSSVTKAEERCRFFDSVETFAAIPIIGWFFGVLFAWLPALLLRNSALNSLASKVDGQLNAADPAIAKVVIQAKNFLVSQGYRFKPENPLALRDELTRRLQPVLGDLLNDRDFLNNRFPFWLNLAFAKLNYPNFITNENTLKFLLQRQYVPEGVLSSILEHQDKIESITTILSELKGEHLLSSNELSNLINFQGAVVDALKVKLQQTAEENFGETLTLSQGLVNQHLPTLLELSYLVLEIPKFEIDEEGLCIFKPNQNISALELEIIKSFVNNIYQMRDELLAVERRYSLTLKQLSRVIESQFKFEIGGTAYPTVGHFNFINTVKKGVNQYLLDHPEFHGDRAKLFNYVVAISTWDNFEDNIVVIKTLMDLCSVELDAVMVIVDKTSDKFVNRFEALVNKHQDAIDQAKRKEATIISADTTDSSDELVETSSGSRSPSGSSDEWLQERRAAYGPATLTVLEN